MHQVPPPMTATAASLVRPAIAELAGYVPGEQPQSGSWTKLNTNENPYPPSPAVAEAIAAAAAGRTLAKYPDPLATAFRVRAAEVLGVDPDWILCGNGSDDLLTILVRTFVGEGEWLRIAYPELHPLPHARRDPGGRLRGGLLRPRLDAPRGLRRGPRRPQARLPRQPQQPLGHARPAGPRPRTRRRAERCSGHGVTGLRGSDRAPGFRGQLAV